LRFQRTTLRSVNVEALLAWPLLNILLILFIFLGFRVFFAPADAGVDLRLPRAVARAPVDRASFIVIIDAKGGVYYQGRSFSTDAFQKELGRTANSTTHVLIKADRRANLDVLSVVWDACRRAGVARVTIATNG